MRRAGFSATTRQGRKNTSSPAGNVGERARRRRGPYHGSRGPRSAWPACWLAELLNGPLKLFGCKLAFAALRSSAQLAATLVNEAPRKSSMHVGAAMCFTVDDLQAARAETRAGVVSEGIGAAVEDVVLSARFNCVGVFLVSRQNRNRAHELRAAVGDEEHAFGLTDVRTPCPAPSPPGAPASRQSRQRGFREIYPTPPIEYRDGFRR